MADITTSLTECKRRLEAALTALETRIDPALFDPTVPYRIDALLAELGEVHEVMS